LRKWLAPAAGTFPDEVSAAMAPRNQTEPAMDVLVGDKTDQLDPIGEADDAETEEMETPVEWRDPWRDN
jgi:hypothetical protein